MKKWIVQVLMRTPDRVSNCQYTFRAYSVYDALNRFEKFRGTNLTYEYEDLEIKAVWAASEGTFKSKRHS